MPLGERAPVLRVTLFFLWAVVLLGTYYTQLWRSLLSPLTRLPHLFANWESWAVGLPLLLLIATVGQRLLQPTMHRFQTAWNRLPGWVQLALLLLPLLAVALFLNVRAEGARWVVGAVRQATSRAALGILGAAAILLAAQLPGALLCAGLRWWPANWREAWLYRTSTGLGVLSYLGLALAAAGLYTPESVRWLLLLLLGGVVARGSYAFARRSPADQKRPDETPTARHGERLWQLIALLAVALALIGALAPEREYDALWYHLWLPKLWLEAGHPVDPYWEYISLYPLTWELLFGMGLATGGAVAAKLLHFACLPLTGLLLFEMTRRYAPAASPWLAVALFVTVPTVVWEATTAYVDLALALHVGLALYALLRYGEARQESWLLLGALNLGLALATKHLALVVLLLLTLGLAWWLWRQEHSLRAAWGPLATVLTVSLLLPLPWYLRTWVASGNPLFPEMYAVFGAQPPERWSATVQVALEHFKNGFGRPRSVLNLLTLPWDVTVHGARYGGALGPLFLLLLPGLLWQRRRPIVIGCLAFLLGYLALWASPISSFQLRFLMPIMPLVALLAALAYACIAAEVGNTLGGRARRFLQGAVALLLLLNLPPFTSWHEGDRIGWDGWLTHVHHQLPGGVVLGLEPEKEYLARMVPTYRVWRHINDTLPNDARILTFSGGDHYYSERARLWSDSTLAYPATWGAPRGQAARALVTLKQLGVTHLLFDKRQLDSLPPATFAVAAPEVVAAWYEAEYEDPRVLLYRLREQAEH